MRKEKRALREAPLHPEIVEISIARSSVDGTIKSYQTRRGELNVFEENLSACHVFARNIGYHRISVYGCTSIDRSIKPSLVREGGDHGAKRS